uniref:Cytochrome c oxidase subunit 7A2, mitochondrial n=1 Tax=Hucho hucho TaxID=62062 RepID=A0A4W5QFN4_9TELE
MLVLYVSVHYISLIQYIFLHQEDNGIPIHLKGGVSDAILYRTTMDLHVIYELVCAAFPKKKE